MLPLIVLPSLAKAVSEATIQELVAAAKTKPKSDLKPPLPEEAPPPPLSSPGEFPLTAIYPNFKQVFQEIWAAHRVVFLELRRAKSRDPNREPLAI